MQKGRLIAVGMASAILLLAAAGPAVAKGRPSPPPPPPGSVIVTFVSAKLLGGGAAVQFNLMVACDDLSNQTVGSNTGYNGGQQGGFVNIQLSQGVRGTVAQGFGLNQFDPLGWTTDPDNTTQQFCDGDSLGAGDGNPADARPFQVTVQAGGGGGGGSAPAFKGGSAYWQVNAQECGQLDFDPQFGPNCDNNWPSQFGGTSGQVKITG